MPTQAQGEGQSIGPSSATFFSYTVTHITGQFSRDITMLVSQLNIYEDLLGEPVSGNISIRDAAGLFDNHSLNDDEFLQITIETEEGTFTNDFWIHDIKNVKPHGNMVRKTYTIGFTTLSMALVSQKRICKSYAKESLGEIITDLLQLSSVPEDLVRIDDDGEVILPYVCTYKNAIAASQDLVKESLDKVHFFYQEKDSTWILTSWDKLIEEQENVNTYTYTQFGVGTQNKEEVSNFRITSWEVISSMGPLNRIVNGAMASNIIVHDLAQKKQTKYIFKREEADDPLLNDKALPLYFQASEDSYRFLSSAKNTMGDELLAQEQQSQNRMPLRNAKIHEINTIVLRVEIPGQIALKIGHTINLDILRRVEDTLPEAYQYENHPILSGKYIVSAMHHAISGRDYQIVAELRKDSTLKGENTNDQL